MNTKTNQIFLGQIGAAHGIKGQVRIATHTQDPEAIGTYGPLDTDRPGLTVELTKVRLHKNVVVAHIKGISDRTAAEALNGVGLYIDRERLPETDDEDDFYHADLIGLEARLETGVVIGKVSAIPNFGAGDLIEIRDPQSGDTFLYPFTKAVVPTVRVADGFLTIVVPLDADEGEEEPDSSFSASIITLFPELFPGPLGASVLGRGLQEGLWTLSATQLRSFAEDRHRTVDDTPSGGGPGMVLKPDILARAIDAIAPSSDPRPRIVMSPRGAPLTQQRARELAQGPGAVIVCGRFEGVDQRVIDARHLEEISIGDYVLAGGEVAAMVLLEAVVRLIPGVLGKAESHADESFENGLLEYPHYTRPQSFEGIDIPTVLTSGDHGKIARWRAEQSRELTAIRRPDLLTKQTP